MKIILHPKGGRCKKNWELNGIQLAVVGSALYIPLNALKVCRK